MDLDSRPVQGPKYIRCTLSWTAGGRPAGRGKGRSEKGWRVWGGSKGRVGGNKRRDGGSDDVREGASGSGGRKGEGGG